MPTPQPLTGPVGQAFGEVGSLAEVVEGLFGDVRKLRPQIADCAQCRNVAKFEE
jgi:hypothetical protein